MSIELLAAFQSVRDAAATAFAEGEEFPLNLSAWVAAHAGHEYSDEVCSRLPTWVDDYDSMWQWAAQKAAAIEGYLGC